MKKFYFIILLSSSLFAQNIGQVAKNILNFQKENAVFKSFIVFSQIDNFTNQEFKKTADSATIVKLNLLKINQIVAEKNDYLEMEIPYQNEIKTIVLYKVVIQTDSYSVLTDRGNFSSNLEKGVHYRGIIKDDLNSLVSMNFYKNQMSGIISDAKHNNIVIGKLDIENNADTYIIYSDNNLKTLNGFSCTTKEKEFTKNENNRVAMPQSARCVTMYFEIGYSLYTANGSSVAQTNIWMNSAFNNVQTLFNNDGISTALKTVYIWTTIDPYNGTTSIQNLNIFSQNRPYFNGDIAQLLIIRGGQGGVAQQVNGLCNESKYSFSDVVLTVNTVPTYSWTVNVIAHELGHLFGSQHTHSCAWNGNNTAIDGCGQQAGFPEGSCATGPIPSTTTKGTVMSYCHLVSGVGVNFANGFGTQPANRMISAINNANCLSTDCINTCITQIVNLKSDNITNTSAKLSFVDFNTNNAQWDLAVSTFPIANQVFSTVASTTVDVNNLLPNTYYQYAIRPQCVTNTTALSKRNVFATTANFCAGTIFTDSGGLSNNHTDMESWVRIISPNVANSKIKVVFNSFDLETDYDYLYIYDGNSISSPLLTPNGLTGQTTPPSFESTAANGALTFRFESDPFVTEAGWNANFSCLTLGNSVNNFSDFQYSLNPNSKILNITSVNEIEKSSIFSIDGKLLCDNIAPTLNPSIDVSGYAVGIYVVRIFIAEKEISFKIIK